MKFVGWDWATTSHDVTVVDERGSVVDRWAFSHTEQGLMTALQRLARHADPADLPVIIERTSGLVVERLLLAGHPVTPVHPTSFHAARPRWGASGAKSDPGDSYKLADYLRTDGHRLRRLDPLDPDLREIQALVRLRDDQVRARTATINQLGALLDAHWAGPKQLFCSLASQIALAFLTDYPTPQSAARLGEARMAAFLRRHAYRGGKTPAELLRRLRAAPTAPLSLPPATLAAMIGAQVRLLRTLQATIAEVETLIKQRLQNHPRAQQLAGLPGVGAVNLAQLLAEVGPSPSPRVQQPDSTKPGAHHLPDLVAPPWWPLTPDASSRGVSPLNERMPASDANRCGTVATVLVGRGDLLQAQHRLGHRDASTTCASTPTPCP